MNEQKQKIISDICPFYKEYGSCEQCNKSLDVDDAPCYFECMANAIISNDYHKRREGEWLKDGNGRTCSKCEFKYWANEVSFNFCPKCGAKMKGGAE